MGAAQGPVIGRIFGALGFDPSVSPSDAGYLLKLADRLTYQEVVLVGFWEAAQDENRPYQQEVMSASVRVGEGRSRPTDTILAEMNDRRRCWPSRGHQLRWSPGPRE